MANTLNSYDLYWLEEPVFPPEDFRSLRELHRATGVTLAAGENACTAFQFLQMMETGGIHYLQPSVTKVGSAISLSYRVRKARCQSALPPHWSPSPSGERAL